MTGHAAGQGQASPGSSPLPPTAFRKGPIRGSQRRKPWIGIQQRKHYQHPHPSEAPDKGQDQAKNGREGWKDEVEGSDAFTKFWHHPGSSPFCPSPPLLSALALGPRVS